MSPDGAARRGSAGGRGPRGLRLPRDGGGLLPFPLLLLPHLQAEPEGHVRPPHLHLGACKYLAVKGETTLAHENEDNTCLLLHFAAQPSRVHTVGRRLFFLDGQH